MLVEDILLDAGAEVVGPRGTAVEALALLAEATPDAAVVDVNLGDHTSEPVIKALTARGVPFLVATGYGTAGLTVPPGSAVIAKPFEPSALICRLAALLS
ncbi:MAG: response regulator [Acetobacteraceae bacterium]|nr:response regulator [Acetobacteraceae bacterium]